MGIEKHEPVPAHAAPATSPRDDLLALTRVVLGLTPAPATARAASAVPLAARPASLTESPARVITMTADAGPAPQAPVAPVRRLHRPAAVLAELAFLDD